MYVGGLNVRNWIFELSSRSLLFASLIANFYSSWYKKVACPKSSIFRDVRQNHKLGCWSHIMLLHTGCLDWEVWGLGVVERKGGQKEGSLQRRWWRCWLEERSWKWEKIQEISQLDGDKCYGHPGSLANNAQDG